MSHCGGVEQSKCVYYFVTTVTVLSLISCGLAHDDNRLNEINKIFSNISRQSEFNQTIVIGADEALYNEKIGLFVFTQYCGPGERAWKTSSRERRFPSADTYADIDVCCKQHDECPNYISSDADYGRYPGLPRKQQLFSRLACSCDAQFFNCLNTLNSQYASTVAFGYGVVQSYCFEYNYPIVGCNKYSNGILRRCIEYTVDNTKEKVWEWFDVPPASSQLHSFPRTTTSA